MEKTCMTPEEIIQRLIKWSVDDVYNHWEKFALDASIAAYDFAIARAGKESDARTVQVDKVIEDLIELHELETMEISPGTLVYTPVKLEQKDMR
ncbi:hypothetical protein ES703_33003 [subsurface metagenome]